MIKNIVFDFDGTIADSKDEMLEIINESSEKYGFKKLSSRKINFYMGKGARHIIKHMNIPIVKIPFLMKELREKAGTKVPDLKPFRGIPEALKKLQKKNLTLGILTSNSKGNVEIFLKKNNLEVFDFIYHGSSLFGKDRMLKKMLKEQKLDKGETVYVGDEDRDIEAAKKVGVKIISVTWGFNSKKLLQSSNPDYLVDNPRVFLQSLNNN